jgi:hypothetical protein
LSIAREVTPEVDALLKNTVHVFCSGDNDEVSLRVPVNGTIESLLKWITIENIGM